MPLLETAVDRLTGGSITALRGSVGALREELLHQENQNIRLQEGIAELQLAQEDIGWVRINAEFGDLEFNRGQLRDIIRLSRLMFLKNPLINRAVTLTAFYVFGQGVSFDAEDQDVQKILDNFLSDPRNRAELTSHQAMTMKEQDLEVTGNLFFTFFPGQFDGSVVIRTIPVEEVAQIITNPEDRKDVWLYKRVWSYEQFDIGSGNTSNQSMTAYYPDIGYSPDDKVAAIGGDTVRWDSPVFHVRVGGLSDMRFGVPETYQALDWARAYKSFLEDCARVMASLARWSWRLSGHQSQRDIALSKQRVATTVGISAPLDKNPGALPGSMWMDGGDKKLEPIKTSGASVSADDGRQFKLMVAAAFGLPETFFGDADVGNHATSKTLDRPTELKFVDRQSLWRDVFQTIFGQVLKIAKGKPGTISLVTPATSTNINITFPPILEHSVADAVQAISNAATLGTKFNQNTLPREELSRMLLGALGAKDIDEIMQALQVEWDEQDAQAAANPPQQQQGQPQVNGSPQRQIAAAAKELRDGLDRLAEHLAA